MSTSINNSGVTFPDATTQTTAATTSTYVGAKGQVFTSSGTFTIPTGVTAVKVTVIGGGGQGEWANYSCGAPETGHAGGTTSVSSGTQAITTISATGGAGSSFGTVGSTTNTVGPVIPFALNVMTSLTYKGMGGPSWPCYSPGGGAGGCGIQYLSGLTPGATLNITVGAGGTGGGNWSYTAPSGAVIIEW